ncbi:MAG: RNA polymerase sigma factor [Polyangiaceae bacterium]
MERVLALMVPEDTTAVERAPARVDPLAELARAAQAGDRAALRRLLQALGPRLSRVVRGVLGGRHPELEDTLQEALVLVVRALDSFRGDGEVEGYAVRITLRAAIAARRKHRTRTGPLDEIESAPESTTSDAPQADEVLATRRRALLRSLLDSLPEAQAETLVARSILGLSLEETAKLTGVPENTVRSRMRLAKEALRERIEADPVLSETLEIRA